MLRIVVRWAGRAAMAGALLGLGLTGPGLAASPAQAAAAPGPAAYPPAPSGFRLPAGVRRACPAPKAPGDMSCDSLLLKTGGKPRFGVQGKARVGEAADTTSPVAGYTPANLQSAYGLQSASEGTRQTVAIVVPYSDPTADADLGVYRTQYGLPPCTGGTTGDGCLTVVDQSGVSGPQTAGYASDAQVAMDMVSAVCPNCHILLVDAAGDDLGDLGTAVDTAVADGAHVVDIPLGTPEVSTETSYDAFFDQPGVAIVAPSTGGSSSGGSGYGVSYPAASPYVTAVGGTTLTPSGTGTCTAALAGLRGWCETVWNGTGSGCSAYEAQPSWQASLDNGCTSRMVNDVSAVAADANGNPPVAVYDSFYETGWTQAGGTPVAAAVIAGIYALAGTPAAGSNPASYPYSHPDLLNGVTSGSNGSCEEPSWCTGGPGYNGPAGEGTPESVIPFTATGTLTGAIYNGSTAGYCMADSGDGAANGTKVEIWSCNGGAAQKWTAESNGKIENANGTCLGDSGGSTATAGANVFVWACSDDAQQWLPNYQQRLREKSLCLGINNSGSGGSGTQLWVTNCDTLPTQQWTLPYPVPTSTGEIQPQASSAMCIGENTTTDAATLAACNSDSDQTWTIDADGTIQAGSGDCLDVHHSGTSDGTEVDYYACDSTGAQQWRAESDGSLLNPESGLCLEPSGGADTSGTALVLEGCTYTSTQEWTLPALPSS
jgi:hypothetical protein